MYVNRLITYLPVYTLYTGDYDGDIFCCITEPSLIPPTIHPPMLYTSYTSTSNTTSSTSTTTNTYTPPGTPHNIHINHIKAFFIGLMKYDNLGRIDIAHIALADKSVDSVFSNECIHLAKLHSIAVDYPKVCTKKYI